MKKRIVLSAVIGAAFVGVFYPTDDLPTRGIAIAAAFFVLLGILFCTMLIGWQDVGGKREDRDRSPASDKKTDRAQV